VVRFDHSVIRRAASAGLPVVEPLKARTGTTWVIRDEATYEIFPFVEGLTILDPRSLDQLADAGRQLGRFHRAMEGFVPDGQKYWPREFHMGANRNTLVAFLETRPSRGPLRNVAERLLTAVDRVIAVLPDDEVGALPHGIIHGDYTWANVLYRGPHVGGIFDFDWTDRHPRLHDLARGLIWFAGQRTGPLDPDNIWHLVQGWRADPRRTEVFLAGYSEQIDLTEAERRLLPSMIAETWFSCRIRAMRKVPDDQKLHILTGDLALTLDFLDRADWPWGMGTSI